MVVDLDRLERILPTVRKPGRYTGGEYNSVVKDWDATPVRVCLAFPDIYDLGMSNLGLAVLYQILNARPDTLAERTYLPWVDMIAELRAAAIPLYSLESKRPLADFDIIGVSLPYEQLFTNLLELLDLAGIPLHAERRDESYPLVIAGGHATLNPEPVAAFVDAFVVGDGEEAIVDVVRAVQETRGRGREAQLRALLSIPGVYVPRFTDVRYHQDGTVAAIDPLVPEAALPVMRRVVSTLPPPPTRLLVPTVDVAHNRATVEIQRGCTRGCRFCHAGIVTRPVRERPVEEIVAAVGAILAQTGYQELGLLSLSTSDYSRIEELVRALVDRFASSHLSISLPALRVDSFSVGLAEAVSQGRTSSFTFAPEAATERMRAVINKPITDDQVLDVAREVAERGTRTVKLYFMIGLPGEEMVDVEGIARLSRAVYGAVRKVHGRKAQVNVSVNVFVPKPHTPLQWAGLADQASIKAKQALLRRELRGRGLKLDTGDLDSTLLEAVLARGDRRLSAVVEKAWSHGARFDAWDDQRDMLAWMRAFAQTGLDPSFYAHRERPLDEVLPWDVIGTGVSKRFLQREYARSTRGELLSDCREQCHACGILTSYPGSRASQWCCPGEPAAEGAGAS